MPLCKYSLFNKDEMHIFQDERYYASIKIGMIFEYDKICQFILQKITFI